MKISLYEPQARRLTEAITNAKRTILSRRVAQKGQMIYTQSRRSRKRLQCSTPQLFSRLFWCLDPIYTSCGCETEHVYAGSQTIKKDTRPQLVPSQYIKQVQRKIRYIQKRFVCTVTRQNNTKTLENSTKCGDRTKTPTIELKIYPQTRTSASDLLRIRQRSSRSLD